jgi:hypothetical protein
MKRFALIFLLILIGENLFSQADSTLFKRIPKDTSSFGAMNMDAVYNRPFLAMGKAPVSIGGYIEAHYQYLGTDGVSDGHSFSIPRLTLFVASSIHRKIKFLSEIELEEGGKEIAIEFASVDFTFHPLLNLRGGIIMNPIGAFNQNHDGPKWEFVDRPVSATQLLPATWSNVGFGLYGKNFSNDWAMGYELYLTNGFNDAIISNSQNKTYLPATKETNDRFEESSNGKVLLTTKAAVRHSMVGELGLSYMGGVYNTFQDDGLILDEKRRVDVFALDFNTTLPTKTFITGEWAWIWVNVPETYTQQYGNKQHGGFIDIVHPILQKPLFGFDRFTFNVSCRLEYVDWNVGNFKETGDTIHEDLWAITPSLSVRPTPQTVIRLNYKYSKQQDILGNPPATTGGVQLGISSYF